MIQTEPSYVSDAIGYDPNSLQDIHLPSKNIAIYQGETLALNMELGQRMDSPLECHLSSSIEEVVARQLAVYKDKTGPETQRFRSVFGQKTWIGSFIGSNKFDHPKKS